MSMLSNEANRLRDRADELRMLASGMDAPYIVPETKKTMAMAMDSAASEMREAADTIENLRDRLQELQGVGGESCYTALFGTPEKAARTIARMCMCAEHCEACPLFDQGLPHCERDGPNIGSIEFWLRSDAE